MKKTCSICGIVNEDHICPYKKHKEKTKELTEIRRFRNSKRWIKKTQEIKERDRFLCRACMADIDGKGLMLNYEQLEVHHIIALSVDYDMRLDNNNLITLCNRHHRMAEKGIITKQQLLDMI